jgi:hypothetical protein
MTLKEDIVAAFVADNAAQGQCGLWPEWTDALLPSLAQKPHMSGTI